MNRSVQAWSPSLRRPARGLWLRGLCAIGLTGLTLALAGATCFGRVEQEQSYFVLHGKTALDYGQRPLRGLVRVRTLHSDAVYEKFQIAVRRNPYELRYDDHHVWVAKPKRMISDFIAQSLKESRRFEGVTRELGERRPDFNLSGNLHAIEVYDSGEIWFAHLSLSLQLTRFSTGEALYNMTFDEREHLADRNFSLAARALSELLSRAVEKMLADLDSVDSLHVERLPAPAGLLRLQAQDSARPEPDAGRDAEAGSQGGHVQGDKENERSQEGTETQGQVSGDSAAGGADESKEGTETRVSPGDQVIQVPQLP
ncbi:MAG: ABC-type transport auxiliary lipoprotein family protein [Pseudomonadota bacterium]